MWVQLALAIIEIAGGSYAIYKEGTKRIEDSQKKRRYKKER